MTWGQEQGEGTLLGEGRGFIRTAVREENEQQLSQRKSAGRRTGTQSEHGATESGSKVSSKEQVS